MTEQDAVALRNRIGALAGKSAWGVAVGHGTFLTVEFGAPIETDGKKHGEWHLWLYMTGWRIDGGAATLGASEDERARMEDAARALEGQLLESIEVTAPAGDLTLRFASAILRSFAVETGAEQWLLYTPGGRVVQMGPGDEWRESAASE